MNDFIQDRLTKIIEAYEELCDIYNNFHEYTKEDFSEIFWTTWTQTNSSTSDIHLYSTAVREVISRYENSGDIRESAALHNDLTRLIDKLIFNNEIEFPEDFDETFLDFQQWHESVLWEIPAYYRKTNIAFPAPFADIEMQLRFFDQQGRVPLIVARKINEYFKRLLNISIVSPYIELKLKAIHPYRWHSKYGKQLPLPERLVNNTSVWSNNDKQTGYLYLQMNTASHKFLEFVSELKYRGFIDADTNMKYIRAVFSKKVIEKPVKWLKTPSDLAVLVRLLHNSYKVIEPCKQTQWKLARVCFVSENNEPFEKNFRTLKSTALSRELDQIARMLV